MVFDLEKIVLVNTTKSNMGLEFVQKGIDFLYHYYGKGLTKPILEKIFSSGSFSAGDFDPKFRINVTGKNVYVFNISAIESREQITPGENLFRIVATAQAAYDNGAENVIAVPVEHPFSRADKIFSDYAHNSKGLINNKGRGYIIKSAIKMFHAANIKKVLTMELHNPDISQFYDEIYGEKNILEVITPNPLIARYLAIDSIIEKHNFGENIVIVSPDAGAKQKVDHLVKILHDVYGLINISALYLNKFRKQPNNPDALEITVNEKEPYSSNFTQIEGKDIIIFDDLVDTAGTISTAGYQIQKEGLEYSGKNGIPNSVSAIIGHPVLSGGSEAAMVKIASANFKEFICLNTHPTIENSLIYPLKNHTSIIRTAWPFAQAIAELEQGKDANEIYKLNGCDDQRAIDKIYAAVKRSSSLFNI